MVSGGIIIDAHACVSDGLQLLSNMAGPPS